MNAEIIIPSEEKKKQKNWIEKNLERMMGMISMDARKMRPLPTSITMNGIAYTKFIEVLKSRSAYFPDEKGQIKFLTVPVFVNNRLPEGTFTLERFSNQVGLVK